MNNVKARSLISNPMKIYIKILKKIYVPIHPPSSLNPNLDIFTAPNDSQLRNILNLQKIKEDVIFKPSIDHLKERNYGYTIPWAFRETNLEPSYPVSINRMGTSQMEIFKLNSKIFTIFHFNENDVEKMFKTNSTGDEYLGFVLIKNFQYL